MKESREKARQALDAAIMYYRESPVGTVVARDSSVAAGNYDHCFTRDSAVSAMASLVSGRFDVVRNFLLRTYPFKVVTSRWIALSPAKVLCRPALKFQSMRERNL